MLPVTEALAQTGEYSIFGLTRAADQAQMRERRVGFTLLLFAVATIVAILYSVERYFYARIVGEPVSLVRIVPGELVFTYGWALLAPVVMVLARRYPVWGRQRGRNWFVQVAGLVGFVFVHIALFTMSTIVLSPAATSADVAVIFSRALVSWTVLDAVMYCMFVAVHHAIVYYRVSKDRALRASQLEARLAQAQLQMLRMQLQPHFLFNTLHSISALMHKDVRRADSMVAALSDLLRMSLQNIGAQEVALQSELEFLQRYVEIMRLRFGNRLQVSVEVDPETRDARVPNLFLQPLVENSFRHGFGDLGQGSIAITVRRDGDMLRCDVVDDGRGLRAGHKEGVGLASTRQRLAHLYGERHTFALRGAPGEGVHVTMAIPFHPFERTAAD
ncbi:MAG TPA: histidine kinase [Gemmatimonadaceae bacterium]|jgi:two-component sensor histidine kinase|nr:histidine kinase [Gemmatimonadaceae bacterium]